MSKRRSSRHLPRQLELLEPRQHLSVSGYRSINGSGNNLAHPNWGTPGQPEVRVAPSEYADGIKAMSGANLPSAREISNYFLQGHIAEDIFNDGGMSAFVYAWGQFIDHDMGLTNDAVPAEPANIAVPQGDLPFDPNFEGGKLIGFNRSEWAAGTGVTTPRESPNAVSAFIDGSNVYGSDPVRAGALREFVGGRLKTSDNGQQLPYNTAGLPNQTAGGPASNYFLAGDVRANENSELTSIHVLMVREHNFIAKKLHQLHHNWNDEKLYQEARKLVVAEIQQITYNEFLPSFMGKNPLPAYRGYKSNVNAQVSNEFATAAFRFGHSILGDDVQFFDNNSDVTLPDLKLRETFFVPSQQLNGGTDGLLKYLASVSAQQNDSSLVNSIRNFLFGPPGAGGFDLGALDVQRGRDHGLADFNSVRVALGLPRITDFAQLGVSPPFQQTLQLVYGNVDNAELFVAGLAEQHKPGSNLGATFQAIIADQFRRSRDGDRYWYQNYLNLGEQALIRGTTLTDIIRRNSTISNLQDDSFVFDCRISGKVFNDLNSDGRRQHNEPFVNNQWVYMFDDEEVGQDNFLTGPDGAYEFSGIQVGTYHVTVDLPDIAPGQTTTLPDFTFTRSKMYKNVNIGIHFAPGQPPRDSQSQQTSPDDTAASSHSDNGDELDGLFNDATRII